MEKKKKNKVNFLRHGLVLDSHGSLPLTKTACLSEFLVFN